MKRYETPLPLDEAGACARCGAKLYYAGDGRPRRWCSDACKMRAYRERSGVTRSGRARRPAAAERYETSSSVRELRELRRQHREAFAKLEQLDRNHAPASQYRDAFGLSDRGRWSTWRAAARAHVRELGAELDAQVLAAGIAKAATVAATNGRKSR